MKSIKGFFGKNDSNGETGDDRLNELAELAGRRAENFFREHRLSCSEASLLVINRGFDGGLTDEQAIRLGSGLSGGVGGSGCICGAISGSVMALGLLIGPASPDGLSKKRFRKVVADYHEAFREESGSVCCRELIADFRKDRKGQALFCRGVTGRSTREAVKLILNYRPELADKADLEFLQGHDSTAVAVLRKLFPRKKDNR